MNADRSLYDLIEEYVAMHEPCYQTDILKAFSLAYSKPYIKVTCKRLWEDARIYRKKQGATYIITIWR